MTKRRIVSAITGPLLVLSVLSPSALAQTKRILPETEAAAFKCGTLIDPASGRTLRDAVIIVSGGRILWVGQAASARIPETFKTVDFGGKTVIPGLIDTHGHLFGGVAHRFYSTCDLLAPLFLAAGVTTVRSPGSMEPEGDMGLRNRIDSGRVLGPRYFHSGPYVEGDPVSVGWMNPVRTPEEVRLKIEAWIRSGASSVKVYANMKGELLRTAIEFGHLHGVKVIGHLGATQWKDAMLMGIDELFHGILALPELTPQAAAKDPKDPYGWLASADLSRPEVGELLRLAAETGVVLTPTAVVLESLAPDARYLDEQKRFLTADAWTKTQERLAKPYITNAPQVMAKIKQFIKMAHDAGCILTTGTDQVGFTFLPGFGLWREMEIFAEAGVPPMDVLRAATVNGARAIGRSDVLGSLEAGKLADFVVLDGNPLEDIGRVRSVHRVVKGGLVFEPENVLKPAIGRID